LSEPSFAGWSDAETDEVPAAPPPPTQRYRKVDLLGVGGMGRVYEAYDRHLGRRVALKELAPHRDDDTAAARLEHEARITAGLEHPGIVTVLDAGTDDTGHRYYTMRLIRGRSLEAHLEDAPARSRLLHHLVDACNAVGYAHAHGVIHRDLKPANVMVGEFGETQVVDWGLAHALRDGPVRGSAGTRGYMSPEARDGAAVDARTDVWSLGTLIREVAGEQRAPDLEAVIRRATASDADARYPDAHALGLDLQRYLDGHRVDAHVYSRQELLTRFLRAWWVPLTATTGTLVLLLTMGLLSWRETAQSRDRAVSAERSVRDALAQSRASLHRSLESQASHALAAGEFGRAETLAAAALMLEESPVARGIMLAQRPQDRPLAQPTRALPACSRLRLSGEVVLCQSDQALQVWRGETMAWAVQGPVADMLHAGAHVVVMRPDADLEVRALEDGRVVARHQGLVGLRGLERDAAGRRVGIGNGPVTSLLDLETGAREDLQLCGPPHTTLASAVHEERIAVSCRLQGLVVADHDGAARVEVPLEHEPTTLTWAGDTLLAGTLTGELLVFSSDGALQRRIPALDTSIDILAALPGDGRVLLSSSRRAPWVWDFERGQALLQLPGPCVDASVDIAGTVAVATPSEVHTWRLPAQLRPSVLHAPAGVAAVARDPRGRLLAAADGSGSVTVWEMSSGREVAQLRWQDRVVKWVDFSADGTELLAAGLEEGGRGVRRFRTDSWAPQEPYIAAESLRRLGVLGDGRVWAVPYRTTLVTDARNEPQTEPRSVSAFDAAMPPSRAFVVFLDEAGAITRMDTNAAPRALFRRVDARSIATDEAGTVALNLRDRVELYDPTGNLRGTLRSATGGIADIALSPDGTLAAAGLPDGRVVLWRCDDGTVLATLRGHQHRVGALAFSADGRELTTADWSGRLRHWDLEALHRPAEALRDLARRTWGLSLEAALSPEPS
jgi:WD40 repeat protein